jgi:hypothetical protein
MCAVVYAVYKFARIAYNDVVAMGDLFKSGKYEDLE